MISNLFMTTHKISCVVFFLDYILLGMPEFGVMAVECNEYVIGIHYICFF